MLNLKKTLTFTLCLIITCFLSITVTASQSNYPDAAVIINESGTYSLENNITHSEPVGVIIAASSVFLDVQGFQITPDHAGSQTAGVWIARTDEAGKPVSDVRITNCTLSDESIGIYGEGLNSTEYPWGTGISDEINPPDTSSDKKLILSDLMINNCSKGIALYQGGDIRILRINARDNVDGVFISSGSVKLQNNTIMQSTTFGVWLKNITDSDISGNRIESMTGTGINLEGVSGVILSDNLLDNPENIQQTDSTDIELNAEKNLSDNTINSSVTGDNLLEYEEKPVYNFSDDITERNEDLIGDIPNISEIETKDNYPLISPEPDNASKPAVTIPGPVDLQPRSTFTGIHATISGDTIPEEMKAGNSYKVTVTLNNDGTDDWIDSYGIGIRALDDALEFGPSWQKIPKFIPSKQIYIFNFSVTAPSPGTYNLAYQAAREGQGVSVTFGRPYSKKVTVR